MCGDLRNKKFVFVGPIPRATCVDDPEYLYPIDSLYYTQQKYQRKYALNLPAEKVIGDPKVVRQRNVCGGGVQKVMSQKCTKRFVQVCISKLTHDT